MGWKKEKRKKLASSTMFTLLYSTLPIILGTEGRIVLLLSLLYRLSSHLLLCTFVTSGCEAKRTAIKKQGKAERRYTSPSHTQFQPSTRDFPSQATTIAATITTFFDPTAVPYLLCLCCAPNLCTPSAPTDESAKAFNTVGVTADLAPLLLAPNKQFRTKQDILNIENRISKIDKKKLYQNRKLQIKSKCRKIENRNRYNTKIEIENEKVQHRRGHL